MRRMKFQEIVKGSSPGEYLESIKQINRLDICGMKIIRNIYREEPASLSEFADLSNLFLGCIQI
jgi:hypothetical protein